MLVTLWREIDGRLVRTEIKDVLTLSIDEEG